MKNKITLKIFINLLITFLLTVQIGFSQSGWIEVFNIPDKYQRDICFVPGTDGLWQTGWAIVSEGDIFKTTDGGDTWTTITQSYSSSLGGISFANENVGFICTQDNNKILKSTDGGLNWSEVYTGAGGFDKIQFKDTQNGVASGTQNIYTSDGGTTWTVGTGASSFLDLDYASANTYFGISFSGDLGQSTDDGATWLNIANLGEIGFATKWLDEDNGFFSGDMGKIEVTHDGGSSWITSELGFGQNAINSGGFFDIDTIYVCSFTGDVFKTTDGGTNWITDTSFSDFYPKGMVVTSFNQIFIAGQNSDSEGVIWRKIGPPPIGADFEAEPISVCSGSSVDFTDLSYGMIDSWVWTFEGGTPATSTDQNPTVTYNTPGVYDVTLVVTVGALNDTEIKTNYINVVLLPVQAEQPTGANSVCTGTTEVYTTSEVQYAEDYDWEITPSGAGTLTWDMNEATLAVSDTWTDDFTIKVSATNDCGDGPWSDDLNVTVSMTPTQFDLVGGGEICEGDPGLEIGLIDSETGVDYELYKNEEATGNIISGTGEAISFGLLNEEGNYTCYGFTTSCSEIMLSEVNITISLIPAQLAMPTGITEVCNNEENVYTTTGAQSSDNVFWSLSPENAGEIVSDGMEATITWNNAFEGSASLTVHAENSCGAGPVSDALEIMVYAIPVPDVTGDDLVCKEEVSVYSTTENAGNAYIWEVVGGAITSGEGTSEVTVAWGDTPGQGYVIVNESLEFGCSAIDSLGVIIDDCTGIENNMFSNDFRVYPNPAQSILNLDFLAKKGEKIEISIFNSLGQLVMQKQEIASGEKQSSSFNIENLPKGIYVINVKTSKQAIWQSKIDKY